MSENFFEPEEEQIVGSLDDLGGVVAGRRKALGLTLEEAAARLGVGRRLLVELEHGTRSVRFETLLRMLNLLGFDVVLRQRGRPSVRG